MSSLFTNHVAKFFCFLSQQLQVLFIVLSCTHVNRCSVALDPWFHWSKIQCHNFWKGLFIDLPDVLHCCFKICNVLLQTTEDCALSIQALSNLSSCHWCRMCHLHPIHRPCRGHSMLWFHSCWCHIWTPCWLLSLWSAKHQNVIQLTRIMLNFFITQVNVITIHHKQVIQMCQWCSCLKIQMKSFPCVLFSIPFGIIRHSWLSLCLQCVFCSLPHSFLLAMLVLSGSKVAFFTSLTMRLLFFHWSEMQCLKCKHFGQNCQKSSSKISNSPKFFRNAMLFLVHLEPLLKVLNAVHFNHGNDHLSNQSIESFVFGSCQCAFNEHIPMFFNFSIVSSLKINGCQHTLSYEVVFTIC